MVSKESSKCLLTNSESETEAAASLALEMKYSLDPNRQIRKRNKALQVRFKDICEAQNEQRELWRKSAKPISYKVAYRKYMTVPARRSIPNVTKSTGVQTSPDLKKRYQTFPFERKKGHTIKHAAAVEGFKSHNNGFVIDVKGNKDKESSGEAAQCSRKVSDQKQVMLTSHTNDCVTTVDQHSSGNCSDGTTCTDSLLVSCSKETPCLPNPTDSSIEADYQICSVKTKNHKGLQQGEQDPKPSAKRQMLNFEETPTRPLQDTGAKVMGPIAWNSLTQVECLESPSMRGKRKKGLQLNGLQTQILSGQACSIQTQCHSSKCTDQPLQIQAAPAMEGQTCQSSAVAVSEACQQIVPVAQDGDLKAQLQVMENLISSSQETIKVLLGVIQELEKGEAHREGLSYRTGQDTANCDTCRNSACIIYSVELDFKQQEDKLQPLLKRLCPTEDTQVPSLPYPQEGYTSTPKRKSKTESKKHARWKLWFL
ncbi:F196A protein, partial [Atractosteus spatula]|nr:F196A protein [Atractosteus spatula]